MQISTKNTHTGINTRLTHTRRKTSHDNDGTTFKSPHRTLVFARLQQARGRRGPCWVESSSHKTKPPDIGEPAARQPCALWASSVGGSLSRAPHLWSRGSNVTSKVIIYRNPPQCGSEVATRGVTTSPPRCGFIYGKGDPPRRTQRVRPGRVWLRVGSSIGREPYANPTKSEVASGRVKDEGRCAACVNPAFATCW